MPRQSVHFFTFMEFSKCNGICNRRKVITKGMQVKEVHRRNNGGGAFSVSTDGCMIRFFHNEKKDTDNGRFVEFKHYVLHLIVRSARPSRTLVHWFIFHDIPWMI